MKRPKQRWLAHLVWIVVVAFSISCTSPPPARVDPSPGSSRKSGSDASASVSVALVEAHNEKRARAGLAPLVQNSLLDAAAQAHAREMADRRKMSHNGRDGSSPFDRIKAQGYRFSASGENVAFGFDDVDSVMTGWMNSRGHRRNILGNFSEIGVGRAIASDGASYWCVTFGTRDR